EGHPVDRPHDPLVKIDVRAKAFDAEQGLTHRYRPPGPSPPPGKPFCCLLDCDIVSGALSRLGRGGWSTPPAPGWHRILPFGRLAAVPDWPNGGVGGRADLTGRGRRGSRMRGEGMETPRSTTGPPHSGSRRRPSPVSPYRVLVYSHDSFGLGHLRRCRA